MPFVITQLTSTVLAEMLENTDRGPEDLIRLVSDDQGIGLVLGKKKEGDRVFKSGGEPILVVEPAVYRALPGFLLDVRLTSKGYTWSLLEQECPFTTRTAARPGNLVRV